MTVVVEVNSEEMRVDERHERDNKVHFGRGGTAALEYLLDGKNGTESSRISCH